MNPFTYYLDKVAQDSGYASYEEYFVVVTDTLLGKERIDALNRMNAEAADRWARQDDITTTVSNGETVTLKRGPFEGRYSGELCAVTIEGVVPIVKKVETVKSKITNIIPPQKWWNYLSVMRYGNSGRNEAGMWTFYWDEFELDELSSVDLLNLYELIK